MIRIWLPALLRRQPARLLGAATGVAIAVALLASLGAFLAHAKASMTGRAVRSVSVDWQVQVSPGRRPQPDRRLGRAHPRACWPARRVGFLQVPGLSTTTAGTTQTTGSAVILGLPSHYADTFPGEIRTLPPGRRRGPTRPADRLEPARRPRIAGHDPATRTHPGRGHRRRCRRPAAGELAVPEGRRASRRAAVRPT